MINEKYSIKKNKLQNRIEPFLFNELDQNLYNCQRRKASSLLTWNRLDLAFKLFYLDIKDKNKEYAKKIYMQDIKAQTLGKFEEYGNKKKNSFEKYIDDFNTTFESIKKNGFDKDTTLLPLSKNNTIRNGSHRLACAIYLKKEVECVNLNCNDFIVDYNYFYERDVSEDILDTVTNKFIEYADNVYIAFLWPSGVDNKKEAESKFSKIIYKKEIQLNIQGALNLLIELYKHMEWVGTIENGFQGANQKLIECFPNFNSVKVIAFQADNLNEVRKIKEEVRKIYNIGFSSIHITDTKEEAIRISKLVFNENGLHFLNNATPYKYVILHKELEKFEIFLKSKNIPLDDVLIDSSTILALYGIRKNNDIDYLSFYDISHETLYENHDQELKYYNDNKEDLIYNQKNFFHYKKFKFLSFKQLYIMKKNRNQKKDIYDCKSMNALIENDKIKKTFAIIKQKLFYQRVKTYKNYNKFKLYILKKTGLYTPLRAIYHKIKGIKV